MILCTASSCQRLLADLLHADMKRGNVFYISHAQRGGFGEETEKKIIYILKGRLIIMIKELVKTGKLYGYNTDYYSGGKGIVIADNENDAKQKIRSAYLKHGYSENELTELEVWKIAEEPFEDAPDVLEIWE